MNALLDRLLRRDRVKNPFLLNKELVTTAVVATAKMNELVPAVRSRRDCRETFHLACSLDKHMKSLDKE
jgi:hypothetical protein